MSVSWHEADVACMERALELAARGLYTTTPNPRVGCVITREGSIVGEGWHERAGEAHAEVHALRQAGAAARGGCAYVTLEPCSHQGRTPPCADALIAAGLRRVVVALEDPNPQVAGAGIARLRAAGLSVEVGLRCEQATQLNLGFLARMRRQTPWVRAKVAMSLDGRTALANGVSQWITGEAARADGHRLRARSCAVLTGMGTVRADDPTLTVRAVQTTRQPVRIVLDQDLETPLEAKILGPQAPTWLVTCNDDVHQARRYQDVGAQVLVVERTATGHMNLSALLRLLGQRQLNEVTLEAGARLTGAFLQERLLDEFVFYVAPALLGEGGPGVIAGAPLTALTQRHGLNIQNISALGADWRIDARCHYCEEC